MSVAVAHVRLKFACSSCDAITQAPAPPMPMPTPRGRATRPPTDVLDIEEVRGVEKFTFVMARIAGPRLHGLKFRRECLELFFLGGSLLR
jgi:hypothetical protein